MEKPRSFTLIVIDLTDLDVLHGVHLLLPIFSLDHLEKLLLRPLLVRIVDRRALLSFRALIPFEDSLEVGYLVGHHVCKVHGLLLTNVLALV